MDSHDISKNAMVSVLCWVLVCAILQGCFADVPRFWKNTPSRSGSSIILHLDGNVFPSKHFSVSLNIGSSQKAFNLLIDTGSDFTWVECDYNRKGSVEPNDRRYKPQGNFEFVRCDSSLCAALDPTVRLPCESPKDPCPFNYIYADESAARGVVVRDSFSLLLKNGTRISRSLAFGCASDVKYRNGRVPRYSGLLGLSESEASILSQLIRVTNKRNVLGHCLSARGGGFLFFGADHDLPSGITWVPMSAGSSAKEYVAGPAVLLHNGKPIGEGDLQVVLDSGSTMTYFKDKVYEAVIKQIKLDLKERLTLVKKGPSGFEICWKGLKPFRSLNDVKNLFMPFALKFTKGVLQLPPEAYLIISIEGHVCLLIEGEEDGDNIIGDVSMQDTMVIYDNVKKQIGWISDKCDNFPRP